MKTSFNSKLWRHIIKCRKEKWCFRWMDTEQKRLNKLYLKDWEYYEKKRKRKKLSKLNNRLKKKKREFFAKDSQATQRANLKKIMDTYWKDRTIRAMSEKSIEININDL